MRARCSIRSRPSDRRSDGQPTSSRDGSSGSACSSSFSLDHRLREAFMTRHCARAVFVLLCVAGISLWAQGREENRVIYWAADDIQRAEMEGMTAEAEGEEQGERMERIEA